MFPGILGGAGRLLSTGGIGRKSYEVICLELTTRPFVGFDGFFAIFFVFVAPFSAKLLSGVLSKGIIG